MSVHIETQNLPSLLSGASSGGSRTRLERRKLVVSNRTHICHHPGCLRRHLPGAGCVEFHAFDHARKCHPVGGDLQRVDHRRPDPTGPAWRPLPGGGRSATAARQPADLWRWWADHTVCRHQADRPDPGWIGACLKEVNVILSQPVAWTIAGCCISLVLILIWDEIRTEVRFRAWQRHEGCEEQEYKQEKDSQ